LLPESNQTSLTKATVQGTIWAYAATYSGKLLVFISTIVLARLLSEEDFGVAGYALVAIGFLEVVQGLGISSALIYYRDDPQRKNTGFWLGLGFGLFLFGATWLAAPLAGWFFRDPRAVEVTRLLGLTFPISALGSVHNALLRKELAFGRKFVPELVRSLGKGIVSITLALMGFSYWSLIIGQLAGTAVSIIAFWRVMPWRPQFRFNHQMVPDLLKYGGSIITVDAMGILLLNVDYLMIGRFMTAAALGLYTIAFRLPELLIKQFSGTVAQVVFPAYSKMRGDTAMLSRGFLQTMRYVSLITVPLGLGLALTARPFVLVFYSAKWEAAAPIMAAISLYTLLRSLTFNAGDVYKAQGRPGLLTKLSVVQAIFLIPGLYWAVTGPASLVVVGWVQTAAALFGAILNFVVAGKMLNTSFRKMAKALQPAAIGGFVLIWAVLGALALTAQAAPFVQLIVSVTSGGLAYIGALLLLQRDVVLTAGRTLRMALVRR
jgi:PST family polysaccharide transporter